MPYEIARDGQNLRVSLVGVVTLPDVLELLAQVEQIERDALWTPDRIIDLTRARGMEVKPVDMIGFADRRRAVGYKNAFRVALVAPVPVSRGYARMFQILNDHPQVTIEIFDDEAAARAWLS